MNRMEANRYFVWLVDQIEWQDGWNNRQYEKLLKYLFETTFCATYSIDENRAEDGVDLRYQFGYMYRLDKYDIQMKLDYRPCSMLEMMISMCKTIDRTMFEPDNGDQSGRWFFEMIRNLGLADMDDQNFKRHEVDYILGRFMNHQYAKDGHGSLFVIRNPYVDARRLQIWDQMNEYLNEYLDERGEQ